MPGLMSCSADQVEAELYGCSSSSGPAQQAVYVEVKSTRTADKRSFEVSAEEVALALKEGPR